MAPGIEVAHVLNVKVHAVAVKFAAAAGIQEEAGGVQLVGDGVGSEVERVIVRGLVDPHAPEHDGGVVAVLGHHCPHIFAGLRLPGFVTDVLPAGHLGEDQQADLIAAVKEGLALGIMGGPDGVQTQFPFHQNNEREFPYRCGEW